MQRPLPQQAHRYRVVCHTLCRDLNANSGLAFDPSVVKVKKSPIYWQDGNIDLINPNNSYHGTHVAGIIGAKNDGKGPYGVLPGEIAVDFGHLLRPRSVHYALDLSDP